MYAQNQQVNGALLFYISCSRMVSENILRNLKLETKRWWIVSVFYCTIWSAITWDMDLWGYFLRLDILFHSMRIFSFLSTPETLMRKGSIGLYCVTKTEWSIWVTIGLSSGAYEKLNKRLIDADFSCNEVSNEKPPRAPTSNWRGLYCNDIAD